MHCSAGIHRTGMMGHAVLRLAGLDAAEAQATLRRLRVVTATASARIVSPGRKQCCRRGTNPVRPTNLDAGAFSDLEVTLAASTAPQVRLDIRFGTGRRVPAVVAPSGGIRIPGIVAGRAALGETVRRFDAPSDVGVLLSVLLRREPAPAP